MGVVNLKKKFDFASLALLIFTSLFSLVLLEIVMRYHIFGSEAFSYSQMKSVRHMGESGILQASEHLDILWELRPDLDTQYKLLPFKTNSSGLRDQEYPLNKPENTYRIAVLGDSFTMAEGVAIENAYHSLLEERFNQLDGDFKYEFINFGVAGYSLLQYVSTINKKVLQFKPDAILVGFCAANDSELPNMEVFKQPYKVKSERNGFFHFHSLELLGDIYKSYYKKLRGRIPGYDADLSYMDEKFKELAEISARHNVPILIAYIDNKAASIDFKHVSDIASKYQLEFVDATGNFTQDIQPEHIIYLTDRHPNAAANKILADNLYPRIADFIRKLPVPG